VLADWTNFGINICKTWNLHYQYIHNKLVGFNGEKINKNYYYVSIYIYIYNIYILIISEPKTKMGFSSVFNG